jgi:hypothetical protein
VQVLIKSASFDRVASYERGLELFDATQASFPQPDKAIEHHRALWIKKHGRDPLLALKVLEGALALPNAPYVDRGEPEANIYTSMAATALDATDRGVLDFGEGAKQALAYIDHARRLQPFNTHAVHVQANTVVRIAQRLRTHDLAGCIAVSTNALRDVDRMLILLARSTGLTVSEDIEALEEVRGKIVATADLGEDPTGAAMDMWKQFRRQEGFCVWLRTLYHRARRNERGTRFKEAFGYFEDVRTTIERDGGAISSALAAAAMCTYYDWRVRQFGGRRGDISIEWQVLLQLAETAEKDGTDVFCRYVRGLALAHLGQWPEANVCFMQNRREEIPTTVLHEDRDSLLDSVGNVRIVQGVIRVAAGKTTLNCPDLKTDILLSSRKPWGRAGELTHVEIAFSFAGASGRPPTRKQ